ncbi:MAG: UvrD-helicase domain-containing protein [Terracidiphilus sp.]
MSKTPPPDQIERERALDPARSILVQAPAGSGKTDLLTRRFLRLLGQVDEPGQVVAITFTNAAAAEMRHRVLAELEKAAASEFDALETGKFSMEFLAKRALLRSNAGGWNLLDLPAQLRISTIDAFCRELALQQPLLSGLGGGLTIAEQPDDLYRRAARQTLQQIDSDRPALSTAIADLLLWRDNNWQELETQLVEMLKSRDRWMQDFVLDRNPDREPVWAALRERLERPFRNAIQEALDRLGLLLDQVPGARDEALELARFACIQPFGDQHRALAELAEFPAGSLNSVQEIEDAHHACLCLANLVLTGGATFRKQVDKRLGFPADFKSEKTRLLNLIADLETVPGLESALAAVRDLPPLHYTEDDWKIIKACFTLLGHAAAELQVVFAEAARVDFVEVAQIAQRVLRAEDGQPSDAAIALGDGIIHLLVDEFQDTSRRQHQLLSALIAAWPDQTGRTCFVVGDPRQSIYFFRDADVELFTRVRETGLEIPPSDPLPFDLVQLTANFRTAPVLVERVNDVFVDVFAVNDGSNITFAPAEPAREPANVHLSDSTPTADPTLKFHLSFEPQVARGKAADESATLEKEAVHDAQTQEIVELIQSHLVRIDQSKASGQKYRIAVLARAKKSLAIVAEALREAEIPFRAIELEQLSARPEILDALALGRALFNPSDRVAWLGVLRAPWCGLTLDDLHLLTSADDPALLARPVPELLTDRLTLLSQDGQKAASRVLEAVMSVPTLRSQQPTSSLGTWLQQAWLRLGGDACVDATARANLDLLWSCLDKLPSGEQDLLSPALTAALDKLTALPDPDSGSDCGVQLMTIHKSKGLEFEVVIVPDLQAGTGGGKPKMLSWLERGLAEPDDPDEITEFLIAPQQSKGADRGGTKAWVDRVYRERESQEDRRILYVAATRARDELHLFARPAYKTEKDGSLTLVEPSKGLLKTAWPPLEPTVRARFDEWKADREAAQTEVLDIAASSESNLLVMRSPGTENPGTDTPIKPTLLRRLPADYRPPQANASAPAAAGTASGLGASRLYDRHEGGLLSRALGTAVHALLEELARLRATTDWPAARAALPYLEPRIAAQVRAQGVDQAQAATLAAEALKLALAASHDPAGQWILSPHADAASEVRWAGVVAGSLSTVRVDRIFRSGLTPRLVGEQESADLQAWWIIDYKTTHADLGDSASAMPALRALFAPQLEAYAKILRNLHGADAVLRAGLYYPRMMLLDWWEM